MKTFTLGEIYLYGLRNPQRFGWDPKDGRLFVAEIGQNIVEEVSVAAAGANLGWNQWEASFRRRQSPERRTGCDSSRAAQ